MTATKPLRLEPSSDPRIVAEREAIASWCERESAITRVVDYDSGCVGSGWVEALEETAAYIRASIEPEQEPTARVIARGLYRDEAGRIHTLDVDVELKTQR